MTSKAKQDLTKALAIFAGVGVVYLWYRNN